MFELKKTVTLSTALFLAASMPVLAEDQAPAFQGFNDVLGIEANAHAQAAPSDASGESEDVSTPPGVPNTRAEAPAMPEATTPAAIVKQQKLKVPDPDSAAFQDLRKKMMAAKGKPETTDRSIHDMTREELSEMVRDKQEEHIKDRMQSVFKSNRALAVDSGENRITQVSLGNFNRFVTPFDDPKVYSTCPESKCKSFVERNVVFFATADKQPRGLFISPSDDPSISISLTVKPDALINPQEYTIELNGYKPDVKTATEADPVAASDFEGMGQSKYMKWVRETFDILARGEIPPGYTVGDPDHEMTCQLDGLKTSPGQVLNGTRFRIDVYKVLNPASYVQQITESACFEDGVKFVFTLPNPKLSPGDSLELFVMRTKPTPRFNLRPKLVGQR